jgi:hypothetical protein
LRPGVLPALRNLIFAAILEETINIETLPDLGNPAEQGAKCFG